MSVGRRDGLKVREGLWDCDGERTYDGRDYCFQGSKEGTL